jgi:hypothetical protein
MALPGELPDGWFGFSPEAKSQWLTSEGVTPDDLLRVGVSQAEITFMQQNYGYDPNQAYAIEQQRIEQELMRQMDLDRAEQQRAIEQQRREAEIERLIAEQQKREQAVPKKEANKLPK